MKFIAHRGACLECLEDTLASLMRGAEYGAFAVECDPRLTKDGVYVLFHDDDLMRIAGDPHKRAELTYKEMKEILEKAGKELTTLDELLEGYTGKSSVLFDLPYRASEELIKKLAGAPFHTIMGVHALNEAEIARKYFPQEDILAFMPKPEMARDFADAGAGNLRLWEFWLNDFPIEKVRRTIPVDREIWIMSADLSIKHPLHCMNCSKAQIDRLTEQGADGILMNDIALCKEYIH